MTGKNLVTPKAAAKHELLFKKPEAEVNPLKNSSFLAPALGVTKIHNCQIFDFAVLLKSDLYVQQICLRTKCDLIFCLT